MKRGEILIVAFLICIIILIAITAITSKAITGKTITGETITGKASAQPTNVSIFLSGAIPALTLLSPENITYSTATSLLLNYTVSSANQIWYNLDLGNNITITSFIYFDTTHGQHTLWLYANNTYGTTTRNVTFVANVTTTAVTTAPGGGGGGGGATTKKAGFSVDQETIKIKLKQGEIFKSGIKIKNAEKSIQKFKIEQIALDEFVVIPEKEFFIGAEDEKRIELIFTSQTASTHTGKIIISSEKEKKEIPVILEVKSRVLLFDITLNIPTKYKNVKSGEDVSLDITIFNLGEIEGVDLKINYYIKDFEGKIISEEEESIAVEKQVSFLKILKLPEDIPDGEYLAGADVKYDISLGTASDIFYVGKVKKAIESWILIVLILGIITIIASTFFIISHFNKKIKEVSKNYSKELNRIGSRIREGHLKLAEAVKMRERLKLQFSLLNKAYEKGYISKEAYEDGRQKIKEVYKHLKKKYL